MLNLELGQRKRGSTNKHYKNSSLTFTNASVSKIKMPAVFDEEMTKHEIETGKTMDIEIMSSYCPTYRKITKMPKSIESETLAADHVRHSNFKGFTLKMEAVGAKRIFQRSIVKEL
ncbi:hypothetical protein TNIN_234871 [Trichonephila inaurata madagascariensis]|uniref:Uncharacterized protein n=1 Tax=Trichonephila inaurata madagascariensis TaxID=2747483 RepID=A0A8X6JKY4_9ARAC|nr:hypothetical protein TNIN_234871 [Trichonephila inaurata madagascariensis]